MKTKLFITLSLFFICFMQACKKDIDTAKPVNISLQLAVKDAAIDFKVPYDLAEVTLTNKINNSKITTKPTADGKISLINIAPGTYSIAVSLTIPAAKVTELSGQVTDEDLHLNYSADNQIYTNDVSGQIELMSSGPIGNWVFKQIYYAGSNTKKGASLRDVFIEIYNNSNQTLYADSLCIAIIYGRTSTEISSTDKDDVPFLLPNNQYDWTKSISPDVKSDFNTNYVYAQAIFMIPSNDKGNRFPVEPGKSLVIAQSAIDYTKPYMLDSGKEQSIGDPTLTIDLSKADLEAYLYPYEQEVQPGRTKFAADVDNPSVPDLKTFFTDGMRDMVLAAQGRQSFGLFRANNSVDPAAFPRIIKPTDREIKTGTTLYPQIPVNLFIDAVELGTTIEKDKSPRRLPIPYDAGFGSVSGGTYSSQSIVRKTKKIINGRRILQDTNNSTADFGEKAKADPSKSDNSFLN